MFQFLLGTLVTYRVLPRIVPASPWFQFLLGTLVTCGLVAATTMHHMFQFLLGTLVTVHVDASLFFKLAFQFLLGTLVTATPRISWPARGLRFNSS